MIEPLTLGIGIGAFLLGHIAHSTNSNKSTIQNIDSIMENHKASIASTSTLEVLDREINHKEEAITELSHDIIEKNEQIKNLLNRADYIRNSGELAKLEELSQVSQNLKLIKEYLAKKQNAHPNKFKEAVLIAIVKDLYKKKYNIDLDTHSLEKYMNDFADIEEKEDSGSGGSFGGMKNTLSKPKKSTTPARRM